MDTALDLDGDQNPGREHAINYLKSSQNYLHIHTEAIKQKGVRTKLNPGAGKIFLGQFFVLKICNKTL